MFRWEIHMRTDGAISYVERLIITADDIEEALVGALKQAGRDFEVYSINKIWD